MNILIFGGHGMAGHMIKEYFEWMTNHEVWYTSRNESFDPKCIHLEVTDPLSVELLLQLISPNLVINAVGLLNTYAEQHVRESIYINSWFPHQLAKIGQQVGFKVIHISTDCVFSGDRGDYTESDVPDGKTVYARTKSLGELRDQSHLTIRTSIIGPELKRNGSGLFQWFMRQSGEIPGYSRVFWNGVTTLELAKAIRWAIHKNLNGLVHLAAPNKLSKYELLLHMKQVFQRDDLQIRPDDNIISDKSLLNTRSDFSYAVPSYPEMLQELKRWMDDRDEKIDDDV